jgi:hypothetical protein
MAKPTLHSDMPEVARDYDVVVIEGARVNERAAIMASDLVVIPVQPSPPYNVWATADTVQLITEVQQFKEKLKAVFVINRKIVNTAIGRDVGAALAGFGFPVSDVALCQRVIYAESAAQGLAVIESGSDSEAAKEIARFAETYPNPAAEGGMTKTVQFEPAPKPASAEDWVQGGARPTDRETRQATPAAPATPTEPMKRFTIDVPESLHMRIKIGCASRKAKMADVIRERESVFTARRICDFATSLS